MRGFVADAFSSELFGGNQAGVILLEKGEPFPEEDLMRAIAGELKHSETAFVRQQTHDRVHIRYFTPTGEVELCGHATIASFSVLRELGLAQNGIYTLVTAAGEQSVRVEDGKVFLTIRPVRILRDESRQSKIRGLYPTGEGAGYAGGIMSAAIDGIMTAEAIIAALEG